MSRKIKPTILIAAALILFAAVYAFPGSVTATELLGITPTPDTPTPDTPTPVTPTDPVQPPKTPKPTEVVLLPATGEFPIDPQLGIQLSLAFALFIFIGIVFFRAVKGSKAQE